MLGGNSGKLRLTLDLAALAADRPRLRVLDVGCAGPTPLNLWEPLRPVMERHELVGVDVHGLQRAADRARDSGIAIELVEASALDLASTFGREAFDVVVSTQVLEHLRDWRRAMRQMRDVTRRGGTIFLTCDSRHVDRAFKDRVRLRGKRAYAVARQKVGLLGRLGDHLVSGEWERGQTTAELREAAERLELEVETLSAYALRDVKRAQRHAGSETRQLWLALEETLARESSPPPDLGLYTVLYLRARRL